MKEIVLRLFWCIWHVISVIIIYNIYIYYTTKKYVHGNKSMKCQSIIRDISSNVIIWKFICLLMNPVSKLIILKYKLYALNLINKSKPWNRIIDY